MIKRLNSISIFFPAYNDEKTIFNLIKDAYRFGGRVAKEVEVIVINDGSQDETAKVLEEAGIEFPKLQIVTHKENQGYGGALKSGFAAATKDYVFYTDGDGQYKVSDLLLLVKNLKPGIAVVNGYKDGRQDSLLRWVIGNIYTSFLRTVFGIKIRDVDCDFRLIKRDVLNNLRLTFNSGAVCLELVKKIQDKSYKFAEVQVEHLPRKYGTSQFFTPKRIWKTLIDDLIFWLEVNLKR